MTTPSNHTSNTNTDTHIHRIFFYEGDRAEIWLYWGAFEVSNLHCRPYLPWVPGIWDLSVKCNAITAELVEAIVLEATPLFFLLLGILRVQAPPQVPDNQSQWRICIILAVQAHTCSSPALSGTWGCSSGGCWESSWQWGRTARTWSLANQSTRSSSSGYSASWTVATESTSAPLSSMPYLTDQHTKHRLSSLIIISLHSNYPLPDIGRSFWNKWLAEHKIYGLRDEWQRFKEFSGRTQSWNIPFSGERQRYWISG